MKDNKGSVVLYAVFLMMALSATAMITAFVVLSATRYTGNSTRAASAFYAAESGIESSLYKIKDYRDDKNPVSTAIDDIDNDSGTLSNDANYAVDADNEYKTEIIFDLPLHESKQVDIFDPDDGSSILEGDSTLNISWHNSASCAAITGDVLEVSVNSFDMTTIGSGGSTIGTYVYPKTTSSMSLSLSYDWSYKIKLKSLRCDLENVTVSVASGENAIAFPNYIKIISTGGMGTASFPMQAETIWKPPLSGLGEFVLFSEETITK